MTRRVRTTILWLVEHTLAYRLNSFVQDGPPPPSHSDAPPTLGVSPQSAERSLTMQSCAERSKNTFQIASSSVIAFNGQCAALHRRSQNIFEIGKIFARAVVAQVRHPHMALPHGSGNVEQIGDAIHVLRA